MLSRSRREFQTDGGQDRVRTHLLFSSQSEHHTAKRKRRTRNKFHQMLHKKDEMVQANLNELDPSQWTGNQRILHFGPMAQRDPFFYYYPKGWDILYPAQFGFFPYRTNKFRGNSTTVCFWAFGIFLLFGGALMIYLGYFVIYSLPFWLWTSKQKEKQYIPPIQIAGPLLFGVGIFLTSLGLFLSISTSQFLNEKLRYYHHQGQPPSVTVYTTHFKQPRAIYETNPYQSLPPPIYPILENRHANTSILSSHAELKLYPPVMPGQSTLSLHGKLGSFVGSPYNTLRTTSSNRVLNSAEPVYKNFNTYRAGSVTSHRQSVASLTDRRRSKSVGAPMQRSSSNQNR